jgi:hypothetical protein
MNAVKGLLESRSSLDAGPARHLLQRAGLAQLVAQLLSGGLPAAAHEVQQDVVLTPPVRLVGLSSCNSTAAADLAAAAG